MSDVVKMLRASYDDLEWLNQHFDALQSSHNGQFVAVRRGRVVASAKSADALLASLKRKRVSPTSTIIKHVSTIRDIL
jgi:hypothetical protein